jgi:hypothetical protein
MATRTLRARWALVLGGALCAAAANAQPRLSTLTAGGGVVDFAGDSARFGTKLGGSWDVRVMLTDDSPLAVELGYVGTVNGLNNVLQPVAPGGSIVGTAFEGDLRLNLLGSMRVSPYVFGGAGYNRFNLVGENGRNQLGINGADNTLVIPWGGGVSAYITRQIVADGRFTYRAMFDDDMLHTTRTGAPGAGSQNLAQWTATARLGYAF